MAAKKILITGHNGYIGPLLVNLLQEKGYEIIGVDVNYFDDSCEFFPKGFTAENSGIFYQRKVKENFRLGRSTKFLH